MFEVNNKDTWRRSDVFIVHLENISHVVLVLLLLSWVTIKPVIKQ